MTPPKVIYLQWYDENGEDLNDLDERVTWSVNRINESDVPYLRDDFGSKPEREEPE